MVNRRFFLGDPVDNSLDAAVGDTAQIVVGEMSRQLIRFAVLVDVIAIRQHLQMLRSSNLVDVVQQQILVGNPEGLTFCGV